MLRRNESSILLMKNSDYVQPIGLCSAKSNKNELTYVVHGIDTLNLLRIGI